MSITVSDVKEKVCITIKDVRSIRVEGFSQESMKLICNGEFLVANPNESRIMELFKQLSTKIDMDVHYCIIEESNGKYNVIPYDPNRF